MASPRTSPSRAHPRLCGEHNPAVGAGIKIMGSSPPVRGALISLSSISTSPGLIPACAGSTDGVQAIRVQDGAHPRLCGEHLIQVTHSESVAGSSPPVRGALPARMGQPRYLGLIPACAGSTIAGVAGAPASRAHPRPCGEHVVADVVKALAEGSSPPVRGAPRGRQGQRTWRGLIPARAGSTPVVPGTSSPGRAHPRPCGEHDRIRSAAARCVGSSPPVRGALIVRV